MPRPTANSSGLRLPNADTPSEYPEHLHTQATSAEPFFPKPYTSAEHKTHTPTPTDKAAEPPLP